jgi:two-component system phosphate regulon sensor histidine kinase PhoR
VKKNKIFLGSLFISLIICAIFFIIYFSSSIFFNNFKTSIISILVLFLSVFLVVNFSFKIFLIENVKKLLNEFYSKEYDLNDQRSTTDLEALSKSLKRFASDKKLEIELLKNKENYRKDFIGNISHELKTPLFTIQSYILTLIEGGHNDPDVLIKYLKRSSKALDRLIYLVKDLDLITQFEAGIKNIELSSFDLLKIINNVFELLEVQSKKSNISLIFDREYRTPINVFADEERIQQVITNLIMNSVKYGVDSGTTEISIHDLNVDKFIIRITDNGQGINKEHLPRLFERFYRVDKSGNRKKGGSGLGLAIVKHVMEAHKEKMYVESTEGIGSEFSFTLQKSKSTG